MLMEQVSENYALIQTLEGLNQRGFNESENSFIKHPDPVN